MILDYLKERFPRLANDRVAENYMESLKLSNKKAIFETCGFVVYELRGDALIVHDAYLVPEFRKQGHVERIFKKLIKEAQEAGKSVIISFSQFAGANHELGVKAMQRLNFSPVFLTNNYCTFVRGVEERL